MQPRVRVLTQLVRDSLYVIDEHAVAQAIILRALLDTGSWPAVAAGSCALPAGIGALGSAGARARARRARWR